jgi:phage I-like protein
MPRPRDLSAAIALAACAFALPAPADGNTITIQLTPAGEFRPRDGRDMPVDAWRIDADIAARVIERFRARASAPVLDYEHQTLNAVENGQPAPAAGWIRDMAWRDGQGLFATVELTQRALDYVRAGEYRYVSPVMQFDKRTGAVLAIEMAALTNHPALDGMQPLALRAAAKFLPHETSITEESSMNKLLAAVVAALSLAQDTTEDAAIAALTAHLADRDGVITKLRQSLGVAADAKPDAMVAACTALREKAAAGAPDPAQYVAVATFETVKTELAALKSQVQTTEVAALVEQGLADGKLLPAQKDWATSLGQKDVAALKSYLDSAAPIAALRSTQTHGDPPAGGNANDEQLTDAELAVCRATGVSSEDFKKSRAATKAAA